MSYIKKMLQKDWSLLSTFAVVNEREDPPTPPTSPRPFSAARRFKSHCWTSFYSTALNNGHKYYMTNTKRKGYSRSNTTVYRIQSTRIHAMHHFFYATVLSSHQSSKSLWWPSSPTMYRPLTISYTDFLKLGPKISVQLKMYKRCKINREKANDLAELEVNCDVEWNVDISMS